MTHMPRPHPVRYRQCDTLQDMLKSYQGQVGGTAGATGRRGHAACACGAGPAAYRLH